MEFDQCVQQCLSAGGRRRPPPTVNFGPVEDAARMVAMTNPELGAWMRDVGLNPASGVDAVLAAATAISIREASYVSAS